MLFASLKLAVTGKSMGSCLTHLIKWAIRVTETSNILAITQSLVKCLAHCNCAILCCVMVINMQVAFAPAARDWLGNNRLPVMVLLNI